MDQRHDDNHCSRIGNKKIMLKHMSYELNDRILCKYGDLYYEGKIVNISTNADGRVFRVHYQGWHKRHDVDIPEQQSKQLFLPYTAENLARTKTELENARLERKRKSTCKNASAANANTSTNASSASPVVTPRRDVNIIVQYYGCLPQSLRDILEKDRDAVIHRRLLAKLPAMYTIDVIIYEFLNSLRIDVTKKGDKLIVFFDDDVSSSRISDLIRSCQMITDYFNLMLGKMLLYPPERDQYQSELLRLRLSNLNDAEDSKERPHLGSTQLPDNSIPVRHTSVYGLPHLLRFFNSLTEKSEGMSVDSGPLLALKVITSELVDFLNENREKYFSVRRDYEPQE
ncbi:hypothetical protein DICVIV_01619 [Dictyocaulus viviparus]|uniref:Uncharacterized protein n=1 Tax=Dictyocaulus viviparus TaxID=29172 RepID=A0A0D8Y829_DICVI|nr:hypothetical protein DICVIV_01619 [Dictyocaulus viviparus]